jgi:hypothetical protein
MVGEMVEDSMVERMRQVFLVVKHEAGVPQELREQTHSDKDLGMVGEMVEDSMVERMRQVFLVVKHEAGVPQELREQTHSDESLQPLFATSLGIHCVGMGKQLVVVLYVLVDAS